MERHYFGIDRLDHDTKRELLEDYYDVISKYFERLATKHRLVLGIHTYDKFNDAGTIRPVTSVIYRSIGYQEKSRMPFGVFDSMYPNILGEFTADRKLVARISLNLEVAGIGRNRSPAH